MCPTSHIGYFVLAANFIFSLASASACTSEVALAVTPIPENNGLDAIIQGEANCAAVAAVGTSSCSRKRASSELECTLSETCILYATVLLCIDFQSGLYHDEYDGAGNDFSGEYTASNGETQTITGTVIPTPVVTSAGKTITSSRSSAIETGAASDPTASLGGKSGAGLPSQTSEAAAQKTNEAKGGRGFFRSLLAVAVTLAVVAMLLS